MSNSATSSRSYRYDHDNSLPGQSRHFAGGMLRERKPVLKTKPLCSFLDPAHACELRIIELFNWLLFAKAIVSSAFFWLSITAFTHGQELAQQPKNAGTVVASLSAAIPQVKALVEGAWTRDWTETIAQLPPVSPKTLQLNGKSIAVDEASFYSARYGSPLAYARAFDLAEHYGFRPRAKTRIIDFGYGSIGHLRMLALAGIDASGIDVAPLLPKLYEGETGKLGAGSVSLFHGKFPSDAKLLDEIGQGYDLFLSKNTLKRGYIHPSREVSDKRMLISLEVTDQEFLTHVHAMLTPGGLLVIYNFCPAKASSDQAYIPWADGESPFSQNDLASCGFEVLAFDTVDNTEARKLAKALGWDSEGKMDLEHELFAWFTIARKN